MYQYFLFGRNLDLSGESSIQCASGSLRGESLPPAAISLEDHRPPLLAAFSPLEAGSHVAKTGL